MQTLSNLLGNNPLPHHKEMDSPVRKIAQAPSAFVPPSRNNDLAIVGVRKGSIYWWGVVSGTQGVDIIKATRGLISTFSTRRETKKIMVIYEGEAPRCPQRDT